MIHEIVTLDSLDALLNQWIEVVDLAKQGISENKPFPDTLAREGWDAESIKIVSQLLEEAKTELELEKEDAEKNPDDKAAFIASYPSLSLVQSLMHVGYTEGKQTVRPAAAGAATMMPGITDITLAPSALPSKSQKLFYSIFDEPGVAYLTAGVKAVAYRKLNGTHPFSDARPVFPLAERSRVFLVGDWATGVGRAQAVAKMISDAIDEEPHLETHLIHLGDTYFAGWADECQERFLDHWPKQKPPHVYHWSLNGNHDMYCGGDGYFQKLLGDPRFAEQKKCSNFAIGNQHWQLVGLDTAYADWQLNHEDTRDQVGWAKSLSNNTPTARRIVLSHHQPFSDYESQKKAAKLASEAEPLLTDGKTAAWLWGHEHRCVVYNPLQFPGGGKLPFGACLGHGGVPCKPTKQSKANVRHALTNDPANNGGFFKHGFEKFALMGYAVLDIDGKEASIKCIHERGVQHFQAEI